MNIRKLREDNNLSQKEVSTKLGISRFTYGNYENEKTEAPYYILKALSKIYNVSIDYILDNDTTGKVVYSEEQKKGMTAYLELEEPYLTMANRYLENLLNDQEQLKIQRNKNKLWE